MTINIGTVLWGQVDGRPDQYHSDTVTGETKMSWLVGNPQYTRAKVSKKTLRENVPNFGHLQWFTEEGYAGHLFVKKHRHVIAGSIYAVYDADVLRKVGELIGYQFDEKA